MLPGPMSGSESIRVVLVEDDARLAELTARYLVSHGLVVHTAGDGHGGLELVLREQLVDIVRGSADEAFDRSVDVHVSHLRSKLGDDPRSPRVIKTVRGAGYLLAAEHGA